MAESYTLDNGSHIAVIGGGPTGSFFSIFAIKMAKMIGKKIDITIFESKDFFKEGPLGCNRCGGIISELLVQTLAVEGINLPNNVVQRGINSYILHTAYGEVRIETPNREKTIATVYRGGGPKGSVGKEKQSFDNFLLNLAIKEGAVHNSSKIEGIRFKNKRPILITREQKLFDADLVVGAVGVKSQTSKIFEEIGFGYKSPETVIAAIAEIGMDESLIAEYFGSSVRLFLLPIRDIKFAAMIPKGTYVTVCLLGRNMNTNTINQFIEHPVVKSVLPEDKKYSIECRCLPRMNVKAPKVPFFDRIVVCGDAGSTRLFKDGIGAAYLMGKAVAKTVIFEGVSKQNFMQSYYPIYKSIVIDNLFGRILFTITDLHKKSKLLTKTMLNVVKKEQKDPNKPKRLSSILWDMFTGNERYKNIFNRTLNLSMQMDLIQELSKNIIRK